jgi:methyl-accepting chemotaxis protein
MDAVFEVITQFFPFLTKMHGVPLYVLIAVLIATLLFLFIFTPKAYFIEKGLRARIKGIAALKVAAGKPSSVRPSDVTKLMDVDPYKHLWSEYDDTLHRLKRFDSSNGVTEEVRATIPAEAYFTNDTLVDSRLFEEFVRHLPGILTGLGIIGTFAGLLTGLSGFSPSEDVSSARSSLAHLLGGVEHAFYASAVAISCAMFITFIEKVTVAICYKRVEQLNHEVDGLYNMGAGEEYLSRLVDASETSAVQTSQLKDALVEDMKTMMTNLVERQIEAQREQSELLGERIGKSITDGLSGPLQTLSGVVEKASGQQGAAVQGMLENLLTAFMAKLEDTFGQQMHNINAALQQSMQSMVSVQTAMQQLVTDISGAGTQAATQMSSQLEDAMQRAAAAQESMNEQMREFVTEIRRLIADQQVQSTAAMDGAVKNVLEQMSQAMQRLAADRAEAQSADQGRHKILTEQTDHLYSGLSTEVSQLIERIGESVTSTTQNIAKLEQVSIEAIDGMNRGAEKMGTAAGRFTSAGDAVSGVLEQSDVLSNNLIQSSQSLQTFATSVKQAFEQYDKSRGSVERYVTELNGLIETVKRDAGVNTNIVAEMEKIVNSLKGVEEQSVTYLKQVNEVLQKAFKDFGTQLSSQVASTIGQTDKHTSTAIGHLNGVVSELGSAISKMKKVG